MRTMQYSHHKTSPFKARIAFWCVFASIIWTLSGKPLFADETVPAAPEPKLISIHVEPPEIRFNRPIEYAQIVVTGEVANGDTVDLTHSATITVTNESAAVSDRKIVTPRRNGSSELVAEVAGLTKRVPIHVSGVTAKLDVDYIRDVMPVISRLGCNQGSCHGSKDGKNGFKLSLRGYDPAGDTRAFVDDLAGRRTNRVEPETSLMLLKASGSVPHGGGQVVKPDSQYYAILRAWIERDSSFNPATPRVKSIRIAPTDPIVQLEGIKQQVRIVATYQDGYERDVTCEAFVTSGNTEVATVDDAACLTTIRRGEAPVMARFEGCFAATTLTVMGDRTGFEWKDPPTYNDIDRFVYAKLKRTKTLPSHVCDDAEFVRRAHIDLTGLPPTTKDLEDFEADTRESWLKRSELVDRLIGSPEFVEYWTNKWSDLLLVNRKFLGAEGAEAYRKWIHDNIEKNTAYDKFAYEILTANGSTREHPAASYYKILRNPTALAENTTHLFLATRFNCNKCHDHPFERWTQDQYYQLSAFFARVDFQADPAGGDQKIGGTDVVAATPVFEVVSEKADGEVRHARTNAETAPKFPFEVAGTSAPDATRREQLARWLTAANNPYFARSYVNRVWGYLMGKGLIEPIDDIRAGNPSSNPQLLEWMTQQFVESGFNARKLMHLICTSRTYQHSVDSNRWNADDTLNYSHIYPRRLPAEVLFDAVFRVTGASSELAGVTGGIRATQLSDPGVALSTDFLTTFGRPAREAACECERSAGIDMGSVVALVNGQMVADAIADPHNEIAKLVASEPDDAKVVQQLFERILSRAPSDTETKAAVDTISAASEEQKRLESTHQHAVEALANYREKLPQQILEWEKTQIPIEWVSLRPEEFVAKNGASVTMEPDNSLYLSGENKGGQYAFTARTKLAGITGVRIEAMADDRLPKRGPGRNPNGDFVLTEFYVSAAPANDPGKVVKLKMQNARATFNQAEFNVGRAIDGMASNGWSVGGQEGRNHAASFEFTEKVGYEGGTIFQFALEQFSSDNLQTLGRFRISITTETGPLKVIEQPPEILAILKVPNDQRTADQQAAVRETYRKDDAELRRLESDEVATASRIADRRLLGAQDVVWSLINSEAFLFNH